MKKWDIQEQHPIIVDWQAYRFIAAVAIRLRNGFLVADPEWCAEPTFHAFHVIEGKLEWRDPLWICGDAVLSLPNDDDIAIWEDKLHWMAEAGFEDPVRPDVIKELAVSMQLVGSMKEYEN